MADEAVHIGAAPPRESYLRATGSSRPATRTGAEAVHPGYGFLSENAAFSKECKNNDIVFIGPPAGAIEAMGSKSAAKAIMGKAGVPLVPGYHEADQSEDRLRRAADGYRLSGAVEGGGRRRRQRACAWSRAKPSSTRPWRPPGARPASAFGDDDMLVEKYLEQPRHVEVQVFCDRHGNAVYLFERDCSVQRRHQKVIEEAPAPGMTPGLARADGRRRPCRRRCAIDYEGAGTVEFLLDTDGSFYFMEMNTRLQVEHPVTEMITGQDLVEWQLRVAAGEKLAVGAGPACKFRGHAFEARDLRRGPRARFPAGHRHADLPAGAPRKPARAGRHRRAAGRRGQRLLRSDDRQAGRLGRKPGAGAGPPGDALAEYRVSGLRTNLSFPVQPGHLSAVLPGRNWIPGSSSATATCCFTTPAEDRVQDLPLASLYLLLRMEQATRVRAGDADPWLALEYLERLAAQPAGRYTPGRSC